MINQPTKYQERYLAHQERKVKTLEGNLEGEYSSFYKDSFKDIVKYRVSQRIFNKEEIAKEDLEYIKNVIVNTPSSCNRQPVQIMVVEGQNNKDCLQELLVGGSKWLSKASVIMLLITDMEAYKSPAEIEFMPYLDAGFIGMSAYYASEAVGVGCCFVNPNVRESDKETFKIKFTPNKLLGAIALGNYDKKGYSAKKSNDIFI